MLRTLLFILIPSGFLFSQNTLSEKPIDSIDIANKEIRIIFTSANWCKICAANKSEILSSSLLGQLYNEYVDLFILEENYSDTIVFNDSIYTSSQIDQNRSEHGFIKHIFNTSEISYPSYFFIDKRGIITYQYKGYITISEMEEVLQILLTQ